MFDSEPDALADSEPDSEPDVEADSEPDAEPDSDEGTSAPCCPFPSRRPCPAIEPGPDRERQSSTLVQRLAQAPPPLPLTCTTACTGGSDWDS